MVSMMTVCDPGDTVVVFSPFYENYGADAILTGARPLYVNLNPPSLHLRSPGSWSAHSSRSRRR